MAAVAGNIHRPSVLLTNMTYTCAGRRQDSQWANPTWQLGVPSTLIPHHPSPLLLQRRFLSFFLSFLFLFLFLFLFFLRKYFWTKFTPSLPSLRRPLFTVSPSSRQTVPSGRKNPDSQTSPLVNELLRRRWREAWKRNRENTAVRHTRAPDSW